MSNTFINCNLFLNGCDCSVDEAKKCTEVLEAGKKENMEVDDITTSSS